MTTQKKKTAKKTAAKKKAPAKKAKVSLDQRQIQKSKPKKDQLPTIQAPDAIASEIESLVELKEEEKRLKAAAKEATQNIKTFGWSVYMDRAFAGELENLSLLGTENSVTFVLAKLGKELDGDAYDKFVKEFGKNVAADLIEIDSSIRINTDFLKEGDNLEKLTEALTPLGKEFINQLFMPSVYRMKADALERARKHADNPDELSRIMEKLGPKCSIR